MVLTKNSTILSSLMIQNYCSNHETKLRRKTLQILKELYNHFKKSTLFIDKIDISHNRIYKRLNKQSEIPRPSDFEHIIKIIRANIYKTSQFKTVYHFTLFNREITIYFITSKLNLKIFDDYVYRILFWLYVILQYSTNKKCSKTLNIYLYLTSLMKFLPKESEKISSENVNTGYTTTCSKDSDIVIYRESEWFKVFIHESFHNLGLDFSDMDNNITKDLILKIFPVKSDVKLYEAYTDSWAKLCNIFVCSYFSYNNNIDNFINTVISMVNIEISFAFFQAIKILKFIGLTYFDLHAIDDKSKTLRNRLYYEKTSVLSYYIISAIILHNYQGFVEFCDKNNDTLLQFNKTKRSQIKFYEFIEENYRTQSTINYVNCITDLINNIKGDKHDENYLIKTMRKSLYEME